jgi:predicted nucleic acid-binding protein
MVLIDTSVLVTVLRDRTGSNADLLFAEIGDEEIALTRAVEMELLAGALDQNEWDRLRRYILGKPMLESRADTWQAAAQTYFDLRRTGRTVRKLLDCWIAQVALEHDVLLIHNDRDFDVIAALGSLKHRRLDFSKG